MTRMRFGATLVLASLLTSTMGLIVAPSAAAALPPLDRLPGVDLERFVDVGPLPEDPSGVPVARPVALPIEPAPQEPERRCDRVARAVFDAGIADEFSGKTEPATPRPALDAFLGPVPRRDFDTPGNDKHFAHSFTGLPGDILDAYLTIRVKPAGSSLAFNDALHLQFNGVSYDWGRHFGTVGLVAGLSAGNWASAPATTFNLDLSSLPNAVGGPTDIVPSLDANGYLDVFMQDDTMVDFARLVVVYCECEVVGKMSVVAEDATPRPAFDAFLGPIPRRDFGQTGSNLHFAHTFTGIPGDVLSATLTITLAPENDYLAHNDAIYLQFDGTTYEWGRRIGTTGPLTGLLATSWYGAPTTTFVLDLASLPVASGPAANLLASIESTGHLDVYVQDDTIVKDARLDVVYCACEGEPTGPMTLMGGRADDFATKDGPEPTWARPAFDAWHTGPRREFDTPGADKAFLHSFMLKSYECASLVGATLEIRVKPEHSLAVNDAISLQYTGSTPGFEWGRRIGDQGAIDGLLSGNFATMGPQTIVLDLANLPNAVGPATNLLPSMIANGHLDVYVQDDTNVDYVKLTLVYA